MTVQNNPNPYNSVPIPRPKPQIINHSAAPDPQRFNLNGPQPNYFSMFDLSYLGGMEGQSSANLSFIQDDLETTASPSNPTSHTIESGDTLGKIAKKYFGDSRLYIEVYNANKDILNHPNATLYEGMELKLPQHLFPQPNPPVPQASEISLVSVDAAPAEKRAELIDVKSILDQYQHENPLSFITMHETTVESDATRLPISYASIDPDTSAIPGFKPLSDDIMAELSDFLNPDDTSIEKTIMHTDGVRLNKTYSLYPNLNNSNLRKNLGNWLNKAAEVLDEHNAIIKHQDKNGNPVQFDAAVLRDLAHTFENEPDGYNQVKSLFKDQMGVAFIHSLWAIDDLAYNLKSDPYYQDIKGFSKTLDLAAVFSDFNLEDDSGSYLDGTALHRHNQIPVHITMTAEDLKANENSFTTQSADKILEDLSSYFSSKGRLSDPKAFEDKVYELLESPTARRSLIKHFDLNSTANLNALFPGLVSEGGARATDRDYNSYFAIGAVIINRTLGRNLKNHAKSLAKGIEADKIKDYTISNVLHEKDQFEIITREYSKGRSFYQFHQGQHQAFKAGTLQNTTNIQPAYELAYEVVDDLMAGMNRLSAQADGAVEKGVGRSTAKLFYFNQSRSKDFSRESTQKSAVQIVDKNNTHVFFETWSKIPFFF